MTAPNAEWPPPKLDPVPPDSRRHRRHTVPACLAALAVSLLCTYEGTRLLPSSPLYGPPWHNVEPFTERFWALLAVVAAPLAAFAAAGLYCRLRSRLCDDAPRARRVAGHAPLACAAAWYAIPVGAATLSFPQDVGAWLEGVFTYAYFLWVFLLSYTTIPLSAIAALGAIAFAPAGDPPEPGPRQVARRSAAACLAALAFLLAFSFARPALQPGLPNLMTVEPSALSLWDWALLVGVPLAAFAAAGAYGWGAARAHERDRRARAVAALVPLASAAAWLALPSAFWALLGSSTDHPPLDCVLQSVFQWTLAPFSLLYLLLSLVLFVVWMRAHPQADALDELGKG